VPTMRGRYGFSRGRRSSSHLSFRVIVYSRRNRDAHDGASVWPSSASHATTSIAQWPVSNERCAPLSSVILSNSASFSGLIWIVIDCPFRVVTGAESRDGLERGDVLLLDQVGDQIEGSAFVVEMREGHDLHLVRELDVDPGFVC